MRPAPPPRGFTVVELMIILAIVALLAALAWPSYRDAVAKGRRADAMAALAALTQAQERWRSNHATYTTDLGSLGSSGISQEGHYALGMAEATEGECASGSLQSAYVVMATARSEGSQASDQRCREFAVIACGGGFVYRSKTAGGATNASPDPCWVK